MPDSRYLHEVVITAIIRKDDKYLVTRRSKTKKRFGGMWTVPGGKLETEDYIHLPRDTEQYWYNVLERVLKREVREETGIEITNIEYLTSLSTIHADGNPSLVISCTADYVSGEITLQEVETDAYAWVSLTEARNYQLIDGIYDELALADQPRDKRSGWKRQR